MASNRYFAEFIGTFALVFAGCGAIVVEQQFGGMLGHVGVSMVFGLIVMAMIYAIGNISGAHINPAVTLGFLFAGRIEKREVLPYVVSQFAGAVVAAALLRFMFAEAGSLGETMPAVSTPGAFLMEVVLTFLLMFVILNVSTGHMEKGIMAGVAVGGMVALAALFAGPVTGASMNPARSFGPALLSGNFAGLWIYLIAPVLGALLAGPTCRLTQGADCCGADVQSGSENATI